MQPATLLTILASVATASAGLIQRGCYTDSSKAMWGGQTGKDTATATIDTICSSAGLGGHFTAGQEKKHCQDVGYLYPNQKYHFSVKWTAPYGLDVAVLSEDDCKARLKNEVTGCWQGGKSNVAGFEFKSDPENYEGSCNA
ncbi:hypothetical protein BDV95DRAFT_605890 [Massariosphaeria phaeospora]|uniref:AA1-like domain-containing protein n=1 Tax=Massariosphaeria phaeospora TaxID=100035 RepID=A0A7C8I6X6_9PLEO|nr:hypothetical protein BDV95DRAFT_605890 [Massariosphaeria phaeospora]